MYPLVKGNSSDKTSVSNRVMEVGGWGKYSCQYICVLATLTSVPSIEILSAHFGKCRKYGVIFFFSSVMF